MPFDKILIANRGEIAVRIIRGCRALGYKTVAIYADADRQALHVSEADEAVPIGPSPPKDSYLVIDKIIAAAKKSGAGAIHPGYGFLSERADFARAVAEAGLVFIGPDADSIAAMGNKSAAKIRMIAAGVPCVPGYQGDDQSDADLTLEAEKIGLPVMIKAAAGGGGRGMRLVRGAADLTAAIISARSEAENAFGDGQLLIEKAVLGARHVEIQVFGDRQGNVVHFGERDCSIQRRNQKLLEESPSPAVDEKLREKMGAAAVAAAKAVQYVGAGTVEFMLAEDGQFYFLEMNTRLQVEHPVTELVYGVDLVAWQIRVASGEPLPLTQAEVSARRQGWAIEARLCTEDPGRNFLPQTGKLLTWRAPAGPDMRVDHGLRQGAEISPFYDSLQAKLIAYGETRDEARRKLRQMLEETIFLGVGSNRDFLAAMIDHPAFAAGDVSTGFIAKHFPDGVGATALAEPMRLHSALAAALFFRLAADELQGSAGLGEDLLAWQSSAPAVIGLRLQDGERIIEMRLRPLGRNLYEIGLAEETLTLDLQEIAAPDLRFLQDGVAGRASFARDGDILWLCSGGVTRRYVDITLAAVEKTVVGSDGRLLAPIDGTIMSVSVQPGETVHKGQTLAVLEAMKMEFPVVAPIDGVIAMVACAVGQQVKARQLLIALTRGQ